MLISVLSVDKTLHGGRHEKIALVLLLFISLITTSQLAFAADQEVVVTANDVRIRSTADPASTTNIIGHGNVDDRFAYLESTKGTDNNTWYKISFNGTTGYITSVYSRLESTTQEKSIKLQVSNLNGIVGDNVSLSASSTAYENPEYRFMVRHNNVWTTISDFSSTTSVNYKPTVAGKYMFVVHIREVGATEVEAFHALDANYVQGQKLSTLQVSNTKGLVGDVINLTAGSSGYINPEHRIWVRFNNAWKILSDYGQSNTATFQPLNPGDYMFVVHTREVGTSDVETFYAVDASYAQGKKASTLNVSNKDGKVGDFITLTAGASGYINPEHRIWLRHNNVWTILSDYGQGNQVTYQTILGGKHFFVVHTREAGLNIDVETFMAVDASYAQEAKTSKLTASNIKGNVGDWIQLTAAATGYINPEHRIWLRYNNEWTLLTDYGQGDKVSYQAIKEGKHFFVVHTREKGSALDVESFFALDASYTPTEKITTLALENRVGYINHEMTLVAGSKGYIKPEYRLLVKQNDVETTVAEYSEISEISFTPAEVGDYTFEVHAREVGAETEVDTKASISYTVTDSIKILLDPGHGANYNASPVLPGYYEGNEVFNLANALRDYLMTNYSGVEVFTTRLTRYDDPSLVERAFMGDGHDLFLSLHTNAVGSSSVRGSLIFDMAPQTPLDHNLVPAQMNPVLANQLVTASANAMKHRNEGVKYAYWNMQYGATLSTFWSNDPIEAPGYWNNYGVLRNARSKYALLIEMGYHTNHSDAYFFKNNTQLMAKTLGEVLAKYFQLPKK